MRRNIVLKSIGKYLVVFVLLHLIIDQCTNGKPLLLREDSARDSIYYKNPEHYIAEQLLKKKIVMMSDVMHDNFDSYATVLKVLYAFGEEVSVSHESRNIVLILEMGKEDAEIVNEYVHTGDGTDVVLKKAPNLLYEDFEFYSNLMRANSFLKSIGLSEKLKMKIVGFEPQEISVRSFEMYKYTPWQIDSLFLVRDSVISCQIHDYVAGDSSSKYLIFYGGDHLRSDLAEKRTNYGTHGVTQGYFLANYLKRYFGRNEVVTFEQKWLDPTYFKGTMISEGANSDIVVRTKKVDTAMLPYPRDFDYFVFWRGEFRDEIAHRFQFVFCKRNLDYFLRELRYCRDNDSIQQVKEYGSVLFFYLNFICCNSFADIDEALKWYGYESYNGFSILKSDCFKALMYKQYKKTNSQKLLLLLGFDVNDLALNSELDTLKRFEEVWDRNIRSMIFINSIGVLWIGHPDEQELAKKFLIEYSGKDFNDPADYLRWLRSGH